MFDEFVRDIVLLQSAKKIILGEHRLDSTETSSILPLIVNVWVGSVGLHEGCNAWGRAPVGDGHCDRA